MELAVLTAGIDAVGKVAQELEIEGPPGKGGVERSGIHAHHDGTESRRDYLPGELGSVPSPQWEHAVLARLSQALGGEKIGLAAEQLV